MAGGSIGLDPECSWLGLWRDPFLVIMYPQRGSGRAVAFSLEQTRYVAAAFQRNCRVPALPVVDGSTDLTSLLVGGLSRPCKACKGVS